MSNRKLINSEINFKTFMLILWEEKILILGMCLFFSTASFFYQSSKINKSEQKIVISLSDPPLLSSQIRYFEDILNYHEYDDKKTLEHSGNYHERFKNNFKTRNNFKNFIDRNKIGSELKNWFIKNNLDFEQYFNENRIGIVKDKTFYVIFPSKIEKLPNILDEYVFFIKDLTINDFRSSLKLKILSELKKNQQALSIAKKIGLQNPYIGFDNNGSNKIFLEPREIFYLGEKILNERIDDLNKLLVELSEFNFDYTPILINSSIVSGDVDKVFLSTVAGLLFGFFFSISIIYLKKIKNS
jgi:LPS O-antigen subunit length determinant protein (WzzB/FepE family)